MGHVAGVKFFLISQSPSQRSLHYQDRSMSLRWVTSVVCKSQNYDFWKSCLGLKHFGVEIFWIFHSHFSPPHYADFTGEFFFWYLKVEYVSQLGDHHLKPSKMNRNCKSLIFMRDTLWKVIWSSNRYRIVELFSNFRYPHTPHPLPHYTTTIPTLHHITPPHLPPWPTLVFFYKKSVYLLFL